MMKRVCEETLIAAGRIKDGSLQDGGLNKSKWKVKTEISVQFQWECRH